MKARAGLLIYRHALHLYNLKMCPQDTHDVKQEEATETQSQNRGSGPGREDTFSSAASVHTFLASLILILFGWFWF